MSTGAWIKIAVVVVGVLLAVTLPIAAVFAIKYRITRRYLLITWLGLPVRWVRLDKIRSVGTTPVVWAERWPNVLRYFGRYLVVRKKGWFFNNMVITPKNPFVFRSEIYRARDALLQSSGAPPLGQSVEQSPEQKQS
jgi:hypothetical protein